jgi:hypothetical protein
MEDPLSISLMRTLRGGGRFRRLRAELVFHEVVSGDEKEKTPASRAKKSPQK